MRYDEAGRSQLVSRARLRSQIATPKGIAIRKPDAGEGSVASGRLDSCFLCAEMSGENLSGARDELAVLRSPVVLIALEYPGDDGCELREKLAEQSCLTVLEVGGLGIEEHHESATGLEVVIVEVLRHEILEVLLVDAGEIDDVALVDVAATCVLNSHGFHYKLAVLLIDVACEIIHIDVVGDAAGTAAVLDEFALQNGIGALAHELPLSLSLMLFGFRQFTGAALILILAVPSDNLI